MQKIIECVPNFSEGRDFNIIQQITAAMEAVGGVSPPDVDPGASTAGYSLANDFAKANDVTVPMKLQVRNKTNCACRI